MSNIQTVKAQIQTLIDLANTTTSRQDTNLTDGVNALVEGFGQGGSDGIEGGYDVTFYDEQGEELALYSVKEGHEISKPPKYDCLAWQTSDGANVLFPYVPTSDISLYANSDTYADILYKFYGVDKGVYPYLVISIATGGTTYVSFAKQITKNTDTSLLGTELKRNSVTLATPISDPNDIEEVISKVTTNLSSVKTVSGTSAYNLISGGNYVYANFDVLYASLTHFARLDMVQEPLPYDGLANGYDVMFYDENNEGLAFYSIKQGHTINPPVYNCKNWQTSDKEPIIFPYTPTEDVIFYANNNTLDKQLYDFYGLDKGIYPYLLIFTEKNSAGTVLYSYITFASKYTLENGIKLGYGYSGKSAFQVDVYNEDLEKTVSNIITNIPKLNAYPATEYIAKFTKASERVVQLINFDPVELGYADTVDYIRIDV